MRLIVDANVIVSAHISSGPARKFWLQATDGNCVLLSPEIFIEVERTLRSTEFGLANQKIVEILKDILRKTKVFRLHKRDNKPFGNPKDVHIAVLAAQETPDVIITGDKALLQKRVIRSVPVFSVRQFLSKYSCRRRDYDEDRADKF